MALEWLAEVYHPVNRLLRVPHIKTACYLMGYDEKEIFRISLYAKEEMSESGSWGSVDREDLYNFREANNTMQSIESGVEDGTINC